MWRPEPDSFGLSESRRAARADFHVSGKKRILCIKRILYSGSFTLFFMTLLNWTQCSSFSFPAFQKNKQRSEYLFPLLFKINVEGFVNYHMDLYVFMQLLTFISDHLTLFSIKTIVKIQSQILRALLNVCYTAVLR